MRISSLAAVLAALALLGLLIAASGASGGVLFRDDFSSLAGWKPLFFPKIPRHTEYRIVTLDGRSVLEARSQASASGLVLEKTFDVYRDPCLSWRWRVENVYQEGNVETKAGDDAPLRVYVMFAYDPARASLWKRLRYRVLKAIYGKYPPDSSLVYIWASRPHARRILESPYTGRARILPLEAGAAHVGQWRDESVDLLKDYRSAFGKDPPPQAALAVMDDSDNTGEASVAYLAFIQIDSICRDAGMGQNAFGK